MLFMSCFPKINRETQKLIVIVLSPHSGWKLENPLIKKKVLSCSLLCIFNRTLISPNLVFKFQSNESRKERKNEWMKQNKPNQSAAAQKVHWTSKKKKKMLSDLFKTMLFLYYSLLSAQCLSSPFSTFQICM